MGAGLPAAPLHRLPRSARLHSRAEYLEVQAKGRRVHTPHFILLVLPNEARESAGVDAAQCLGVTITRKVAHAVGRNRVKRLCREVFRLNRELFPGNCAVVAIARQGAAQLDYAAVEAEMKGASPGLFRAATPTKGGAPHAAKRDDGSNAATTSGLHRGPNRR